MPIKIVDLFAGPGGLGEGFSSLDSGKAFKIIVSAEMESSAHSTLLLRSYFRLAQSNPGALLKYYEYCNGSSLLPYDEQSATLWEEATLEARQLTLGVTADNAVLDSILDDQIKSEDEWVLIGGPPCQAYSLVGRARNLGTPTYRADNDHRHFLYKQYLRIIRERRPAVFVMENVKGILSSKVGGKQIFHEILQDLADPDGAFGDSRGRPGYKIYSLVSNEFFEMGMDPAKIDPRKFIVRAEEFGIPQARHRVILLGVRADLDEPFARIEPKNRVTVRHVIEDLPKLRSSLSKASCTAESWKAIVAAHLQELSIDALNNNDIPLGTKLTGIANSVPADLSTGALRCGLPNTGKPLLSEWYLDSNLKVNLNHQTRGHMTSDLRRYAYAATYTTLHHRSPKGHLEFGLLGLAPNHDNWKSGKFADRFRVQYFDAPATTVTSHISKDGHYFIHPDPNQCRSLTVREAARLQTFPDNYFFQGNRTQQFHQVGNAVPPMLAKRIAEVVLGLMQKRRTNSAN